MTWKCIKLEFNNMTLMCGVNGNMIRIRKVGMIPTQGILVPCEDEENENIETMKMGTDVELLTLAEAENTFPKQCLKGKSRLDRWIDKWLDKAGL